MVTAINRDPFIAGCNRCDVNSDQRKGISQFSHGAFCEAMCECTAYSFVDNNYWSSSQGSETNSWAQGFYSGNPGNQNNNTKSNVNYVRAMRR